jgi:broad specificity phosphatase PhoE
VSDAVETTVHLVRHGEVFNPEGILYGRANGFFLSERGLAMADRVAQRLGDDDITVIKASPLERAQQTAAPLAAARGIEVQVDERLIESENYFAGKPFKIGSSLVYNPAAWLHLWNPIRPSWGEPYKQVAARMWASIEDARAAAEGHEAVLVSHQLPIWIARLHAEKRAYFHDPRRRQCTLCSVTSLRFVGDELVTVGYSEPAGDMIPEADRRAAFSSGGQSESQDDL